MQRQNKSAKTEEICINNAMTKHCKGNRIFIYKKSAKTRISQKESEELLKKFLYYTHNTGVKRRRIECTPKLFLLSRNGIGRPKDETYSLVCVTSIT